MSDIKCLIVDDEPLARKLITDYVSRLSDWHIVAQCRNAVEAYEYLVRERVDVMFLDINMPVLNGIDFYRSLRNPPCLIFTTAYPEYAVEGFELEATDYLVKPITFDRFLKAAERINNKVLITDKRESRGRQNVFTSPADSLFIKNFSKLVKIRFEDILYLEAQKDFVRFVLKNEELLAGMTMKEAEDILPADQFLRVHRSYIVPVRSITALFGNVVEIGKHQIPIGANYKDSVMEKIK